MTSTFIKVVKIWLDSVRENHYLISTFPKFSPEVQITQITHKESGSATESVRFGGVKSVPFA
jgi:hypothetical protein